MAHRTNRNPFYKVLKTCRHRFDEKELIKEFNSVSEERVNEIAHEISGYITSNLPTAVDKRNGLADYRSNPYVLMTAANVMSLRDPGSFARFLFDSKLYMGLETSFGKSIESSLVGIYPLYQPVKWIDAPEKIAEFDELVGLSREEKARVRINSVWREIDRSCVVGSRRYLTSIKSGPNTINDTQVDGMYSSIKKNYLQWLNQTKTNHPEVDSLDIVLGLTYGTDCTTNNKENQILAKLLDDGFVEEDREGSPGILIDEETRSVRVYRRIGKDFWSFIGSPDQPSKASFVFLEVLLGLAKALSKGISLIDLEDRINIKIIQLSKALAGLQFSRNSLPEWIRHEFTEDQLFWFATAMTAFFDEGI